MKELCSYLRTQCGVTETYFPLDEEGGVHSAGNGSGDPWKWAQVFLVNSNKNMGATKEVSEVAGFFVFSQ